MTETLGKGRARHGIRYALRSAVSPVAVKQLCVKEKTVSVNFFRCSLFDPEPFNHTPHIKPLTPQGATDFFAAYGNRGEQVRQTARSLPRQMAVTVEKIKIIFEISKRRLKNP